MLLMDEPFAALDALTREQLYGDLQRIWKARNKTIVFVTHNVREAACLGDRVIVFSPRPGRIREEFAVDLPRPRDINSVDLAVHATKIMGRAYVLYSKQTRTGGPNITAGKHFDVGRIAIHQWLQSDPPRRCRA